MNGYKTVKLLATCFTENCLNYIRPGNKSRGIKGMHIPWRFLVTVWMPESSKQLTCTRKGAWFTVSSEEMEGVLIVSATGNFPAQQTLRVRGEGKRERIQDWWNKESVQQKGLDEKNSRGRTSEKSEDPIGSSLWYDLYLALVCLVQPPAPTLFISLYPSGCWKGLKSDDFVANPLERKARVCPKLRADFSTETWRTLSLVSRGTAVQWNSQVETCHTNVQGNCLSPSVRDKNLTSHIRRGSGWTVWHGVADVHLLRHRQSGWSAIGISILYAYWPGYVSFSKAILKIEYNFVNLH